MNKDLKDYDLVVGVCKHNGVIVDITYNGIINKLSNDDLEDVYNRLKILKSDVRSILRARLWEAIKNYFRRD